MMDTTKELSLVDRGTLRLWRIANIVGWGILALLAAGFLRLSVEVAAGLAQRSLTDLYRGRADYVWYSLTVGLASTALAGLAIGSIVGGRVYRWPGVVSGVVAALYCGFAYLGVLSAYVPNRVDRSIVAGPMLLVIPVAAWLARRVWLARPRALRSSG